VEKTPSLDQPGAIALQNKRISLQKAIYQWSLAQGEYMPHIKWARATDDFSFTTIHGDPPSDSLNYLTAGVEGPGPPALSRTPGVPATSQKTARSTSSRSHQATNDLMDINNAENINLWLPSDIPFRI
jgi:hypothetical protein